MKKQSFMTLIAVFTTLSVASFPRLLAGEQSIVPTSANESKTSDTNEVMEMPSPLSDSEIKEQAEELAKRQIETDRFTENYKRAATPRERMELCVDAINKGLISTTVGVETIWKMFGCERDGWNRKMVQGVGAKENEHAFIIHFAEYIAPETPPGTYMSGWWSGWYLYVRYGPNKEQQVRHFYLSNTWQLTKGFEP